MPVGIERSATLAAVNPPPPQQASSYSSGSYGQGYVLVYVCILVNSHCSDQSLIQRLLVYLLVI